jgi:hypothetical protein
MGHVMDVVGWFLEDAEAAGMEAWEEKVLDARRTQAIANFRARGGF